MCRLFKLNFKIKILYFEIKILVIVHILIDLSLLD